MGRTCFDDLTQIKFSESGSNLYLNTEGFADEIIKNVHKINLVKGKSVF